VNPDGTGLAIEYDKPSDSLYMYSVEPYAEQESTEIGDYTVARFNPETHELESLQLLYFSKRLEQGKVLELPVDAFKLAG
jgi:hypothetical protein